MSLTWHGYSERGLVNAIFEAAATHSDPAGVLGRLLDRSWLLPWRRPDGSIRNGGRHNLWSGTKLERVEVFVEHSLSDFGEPDVVLLMSGRLPSGDLETKAYFLEAKRESFARNVRLQGKVLTENSSSIVHELFLKYRFSETSKEAPQALIKTSTNPGLRVYAADKKLHRHVGTDAMVRSLVARLQTEPRAHFFMALTTTPPPDPSEWPGLESWDDGLEMAKAIEAVVLANPPPEGPVDPDLVGSGSLEATYHLSWEDVEAWARSEGLDRVTRTLEENKTKLNRAP